MPNQSARQQARRAALDAQSRMRKARADQERRRSGLAVAVVTALAERDALMAVSEARAGEALVALTDDEGLSFTTKPLDFGVLSNDTLPLVVSLDGFAKYQREKAWTWEHMALTRARAVYGSPKARAAVQGVIDALTLAARTDGIVLDPVYSGKAMKGLIALARAGRFRGETVVFLHTGGAQGLFGYQSEIEGALSGR